MTGPSRHRQRAPGPGALMPLRPFYRALRRLGVTADVGYRWRRRALLARLRIDCRRHRARVDVHLGRDLRVGRGVRLRLEPGSANRLRIGDRVRVHDGVSIVLEGGDLVIGDDVDIRRDASLVTGGVLELAGRNLLQRGCSLHCAERVTVATRTVLAEYATVVDSVHHFTSPDEWFLDNVRTAPVTIGPDTWVGAKATVSRGVTIGDHCIVAANSLVVRDVPAGHLASGVPAEVLRPVDLPWTRRSDPDR